MQQINFNVRMLYTSLKRYLSLLIGLPFLFLDLSASVKFQPALHEKPQLLKPKLS